MSGFPTKEEMRDHKRREIVRCASEKFGTEGYENVPLDAIAAELGVTKAALYNYVSSKNDLLMQCYEVGMDRLIASVEQAMDTQGTAAERLRIGLETYVVTMTRKDMQYLWNYIRPLLSPGDKRSVQTSRDKIDSLFRAMLQNGIDDGSLRADLDPKLASLVILGAINWVGIWFRPSGLQKSQDIARDVVGDALHGYLAS
ncbi:TetR/AcrR family transcriptional regulator [Sulfitobacter sp. DFL-23]|nr:TetR/AcrR family transcriptional regulator [Sulfitobacter sp. DFL-23]